MPKKFNPKITPGEWDAIACHQNGCVVIVQGKKFGFTTHGDEDAILAIPQLLKVLEAVDRLLNGASVDWDENVTFLGFARKELDEKHGEED